LHACTFLHFFFFPLFLSRGKTKKESVGRYVRARKSEGISRYVRERDKGRERERRERWAEFVAMASSLWQASASGSGSCSSWLSSSNWPLLPGLPDDIALLCLARLPRTVLLSLRGVSKAWRKALEHPEFYETRVRLGRTEEWLYVESWNAGTQKVSWFAFDRAEAKWRKLAPLPKKRGFPAEVFGRSSTVLDGRLFVVGGKAGITGPTLRDLFIYSPLSNRWSRGRSMINTRHSPLVSVLNGKLYVLGGFDCFNKPMIASECYHFDKDEWTSVESQGHPCLPAPSWYCHGWQPLWQGLLLHNKDFYCSYKMDDSRAAVKHYDPNTGKWELRKPTLKALLRSGLPPLLSVMLHLC
jgi:hypothetical protein